MLTIGSLFSGIGGLELGLEWAGLGPVIWQVEKDEKCRNCLATHWPDAKRFDDVCTVGAAELEPVDLICGGFPCQDVSGVGKRVGLTGSRSGLWFEFSRIVEALRPRFVVVENVGSGAEKWVDAVRRSLEQHGYASLPVPVAASDVGAWHRRERIFIVADTCRERPKQPDDKANTGCIGRQTPGAPIGRSSLPSDAHPFGKREQSRRGIGKDRPASTGLVQHSGWTVEPDVARMVHGLPGRVDRERALGNSVVPQCAEVVGEVINLLMDL